MIPVHFAAPAKFTPCHQEPWSHVSYKGAITPFKGDMASKGRLSDYEGARTCFAAV